MEVSEQSQMMADRETLKGKYANNMRAAALPEEIYLDFSQMSPAGELLVARIVVSPAHLKRIATSLSQFIDDFEKQQGTPIEAAEEPIERPQIGFRIEDKKG